MRQFAIAICLFGSFSAFAAKPVNNACAVISETPVIEAKDLTFNARDGNYYDSRFVVATVDSNRAPLWAPITIAQREAWITQVKIKNPGPEHLIKMLKPEERRFIESTQEVAVVAFGAYPPNVLNREVYLNFETELFNPNLKNVSLTDKNSGRPVRTTYGNDLPDPATPADFRAWPDSDREDFLGDAGQNFCSLKPVSVASQDELFKRIESSFNDTYFGDYEVEADYGQVTIGDARVTIEIVRHADGSVLGGSFSVRQEGAQYPESEYEDRPSHFATLDEALEAGAEESDVSWAASGTFEMDANGEVTWLSGSDYMEWTGY